VSVLAQGARAGVAELAEDAEHLRRIHAVTEAALAHLELDDLRDVLLERACELLEADTAAVLLLDRDSQELVATAARGIEEEVQEGVRIPVGVGFAGRIAVSGRPVILERVDHTTVVNPILVEKGIRSLLGVPLIADGTTVGVLHVGTLRPRSFSSQDAELLQLVADRVALAIRTGLIKQERAAATALQRSLLPRRPPVIDGLEIASRYIPGHAGVVGGDWFDVFRLPTGHVAAAIGDVVGHGLRAAVVMGRIRNALRAYALDSNDPATVLTRLDEMMCHFEPDETATALYGVFDPALHRATLSSAGHHAPLIACPDEPTRSAHVYADPLIGSGFGTPRRVTHVALPAGSTFYFFTDGVVERRGTDIDAGLDQLRRVATPGSPNRGCSRIVSELLDEGGPADDFAVLAMHRREPPVIAGPHPTREGMFAEFEVKKR
jgi:phosphoserine phosphatase RsbU/P